MERYDVIIIGGGAAGLMCAMTAGQRGRRVLLLEHAEKVGKKILISGGGRCNFTNTNIEPERFLSANPHFCKSALSQYTQWDFIKLVKRHAVAYHEKIVDGRATGQLFCDDSARLIVSCLLRECDEVGVTLLTQCDVKEIAIERKFSVVTSKGTFFSESLVIATGGLSIPKIGATGFGYQVAEQFGIRVLPKSAGLVPFTFTDDTKKLTSRLSGVSVYADIKTGNKSFLDYLLFTHRGLSGPAVLQLSSYWSAGDEILLDLMAGEDGFAWMKSLKKAQAQAVMRTALAQKWPKKLVLELESRWWSQRADIPLAEWPNKALSELAKLISCWALKPAGTEGYRKAEVTLGGVDTDELSSKTMESKKQPGLYFIGELVDVTGHLGGFNFQWAWSSGYAAGLSV